MESTRDTPDPAVAALRSASEARKHEHLTIVAEGRAAAREATTWLEHVHLLHEALPELDEGDLDLTVRFAGRTLEAPLLISGMTGGTSGAREINRSLAQVAGSLGIGFGLGSLRPLVDQPELLPTYQVRDVAPDVFLLANLGGVQVAQLGPTRVRELVRLVEADAICVHLNPAHELVQHGGERDFRGVAAGIRALAELPDLPLIVKEVGAGLSRETARRLKQLGVQRIDVAGGGGTSWVGVELIRQDREADPELRSMWDWGIPTAACLLEVAPLDLEVCASGGIRTGLDVARSLALGARVAGLAAPVLQTLWEGGEEAVERQLLDVMLGLGRVLLLTGCRTCQELHQVPRVLLGPLATWQAQRGG